MAITIDNPEVEQTLKTLSAAMGEPLEVSVSIALRERLERVNQARRRDHRKSGEGPRDSDYVRDLMLLSDSIGSKLRRDGRSLDELIGYDDGGLAR